MLKPWLSFALKPSNAPPVMPGVHALSTNTMSVISLISSPANPFIIKSRYAVLSAIAVVAPILFFRMLSFPILPMESSSFFVCWLNTILVVIPLKNYAAGFIFLIPPYTGGGICFKNTRKSGWGYLRPMKPVPFHL